MITIKKLIAPESEEKIIAHWKYIDKVYISCITLTYNHELYVRDTIDSILAQITDYRFEIVIHDDVSTDKTRDILLDYKNKYPSIIKLILQKENQYSKGKRIIPIATEQSEGAFLAICEGDDFWIDEKKIQKQTIALLKNSNVSLCIHKAYKEINNNFIYWNETDHGCTEKILPVENIIESLHQFAPTASYFMKKEVIYSLPSWSNQSPISDFLIEIYSKKIGDILYIPETMSIYRVFTVGSWSQDVLSNLPKKIEFNKKMLLIYNYIKLDDLNIHPNTFQVREKYAYKTNIKIAILLRKKKLVKQSISDYLNYIGYNAIIIRLIANIFGNDLFIALTLTVKKYITLKND